MLFIVGKIMAKLNKPQSVSASPDTADKYGIFLRIYIHKVFVRPVSKIALKPFYLI